MPKTKDDLLPGEKVPEQKNAVEPKNAVELENEEIGADEGDLDYYPEGDE